MSGRISRRDFVGAVLAVPLSARLGIGEPSRRGANEHVVVIGAGAFGGCTALALLRAGFQVTLVDAWGAGNSRASSGGETRVFRGVYGGEPLYTAMAARSMVLWREVERRSERRLFFRTGALWMCEADEAYVRMSMEPMRAAGLRVDELSLDDAARRFAQMSFSDVRSVFFEPEAGFILARAACQVVREAFVREGGSYRQAWARPTITSGGRLSGIGLDDGSTVTAEHFVFACGPWMGQVFPDVIGRRIVATRQEVFFFGTPPGVTLFEAGALPVWVHLGRRLVYGVPAHDGRGLKVADDSAGAEVDPTTMDRTPTAAGLATARAILRERFPSLGDTPLIEARVCQYEASSDGHFLIDRHPALENVWLVGGGSGHGFKMGPAVGEHVAALIQGKATVQARFAYSRLQPQ